MIYTYFQFGTKVSEIVRDQAEKLSAIERDNFIQEAIKIYSKHRPRSVVKDITGDGTYDYLISTNLTAYVKGFSIIKKIEYPADQREPVYIEDEDFIIYEKEAGQYLRFLKDSPKATEKIRVTYTALHLLADKTVSGTFSFSSADNSMNRAIGSFITDGLIPGNKIFPLSVNNPGPLIINSVAVQKVILFETIATEIAAAITIRVEMNTIPESDQDAVGNLAASLCSHALASYYAQTSDSTIGADSVNYRTKSQDYTSRAKEQKKIYLDHIGLKEGDVAPASVVKDLDIDYPGGSDRLTHPRKWR